MEAVVGRPRAFESVEDFENKQTSNSLIPNVKSEVEAFEEKNQLVSGSNIWRVERINHTERDHNAQKPVDLIKIPIENSCDDGEIVLDLFGGSGSTLIACEQLNRKARIMEIEPRYCDVIVKRWEDLTGEKVEKING